MDKTYNYKNAKIGKREKGRGKSGSGYECLSYFPLSPFPFSLLTLLFPVLIFAQTTNEFQKSLKSLEEGISSPDTGDPTFFLFLRTFLVLGALLAGFFYLMKFLSRKKMRNEKDSYFKVLAVFSLGQNRFLQAVQMGNFFYILGISEGSVSLIEKIENKEFQDELVLRYSQSPVKEGFKGYFSKLVGSQPSRPSLEKQKQRLKQFLGR